MEHLESAKHEDFSFEGAEFLSLILSRLLVIPFFLGVSKAKDFIGVSFVNLFCEFQFVDGCLQ